MINSMQKALIKKDIRGITSNKNLFSAMLLVPLVMAVFIPSIFVLLIALAPVDSDDFEGLLTLLPNADVETMEVAEMREALLRLVLDNMIPVFFLMIPIISSTIMAASSFVGEKEKRTLETLLYCPLSLREIFGAKIMAALILSQFISILSFFVMTLFVQVEIWFTTGSMVLPGLSWLVLMLLLSPGFSLVAISMIVRGSAKAKSVEESYQKSVFLIIPLMVLGVGQFSGLAAVGAWLLLVIGVACVVIGLVLLRRSSANFHYERLLL
ncbi:MAG: ABC transporter permease subunit [Oscillospiraceae bacterium]|nr:ABC transporter permease subunit [Oscillospiraceae bacterium]